MYMNKNKKKEFFEIVFKDEETAKETIMMAPEKLSAYLSEKGYDYSPDEIIECGTEFKKLVEQNKTGEIDETTLEEVAGGRNRNAEALITGIGVGLMIGIALCSW